MTASRRLLVVLAGVTLCAGATIPALASGQALPNVGSALPSVPATRVALPGTLPTFHASAPALAPASPSTPARALIALAHRNQAGLLSFDAAVSTPGNALYEHYLTPAQFDARYAPSSATVAAVETFARAAGLKVAAVPSNRAYVYVTGTVAEVDRAFATTIEQYSMGGQTVDAPLTAASVPLGLSALVTGVTGLNTADVSVPLASRLSTEAPAAYVNAAPCSTYWGQDAATQAPGAYGVSVLPDIPCGQTPQQLQGAYGVSKAIADGLNGSGQTVAVIDAYADPRIVPDATEWSHDNSLPAPNITVVDNAVEEDTPEAPAVPSEVPELGGAQLPPDPQGWAGEETLDVEAVHAMAPGADIVVQNAQSDENIDLEMAQNHAVSTAEAQIISNSYGGSSDSTDNTSDGYWEQAAAEGIGVYFSSGDDGDQTAGGTDPADRSVDGGANSPYVTAVGGTSLAVGAKDNYLFETYWGTDTATLTNGAWGPSTFEAGGGGGTSQVYGEPAYQQGVVPSSLANYWQNNANSDDPVLPGRVVPDVAMDADASTGLLIGETEDFDAYGNPDAATLPTDSDVYYGTYRLGGTSLSSPLFAGMMALADQAAGKSLGFANPALYALYASKAFHAIAEPTAKVAVVRTNYVNNTNDASGTETLLRTFGDLGTLSSLPGYDDSTGLGSPDGLSFLGGLAPGSKLVAQAERDSGAGASKPVKGSKTHS